MALQWSYIGGIEVLSNTDFRFQDLLFKTEASKPGYLEHHLQTRLLHKSYY